MNQQSPTGTPIRSAHHGLHRRGQLLVKQGMLEVGEISYPGCDVASMHLPCSYYLKGAPRVSLHCRWSVVVTRCHLTQRFELCPSFNGESSQSRIGVNDKVAQQR